MFGADADYAHQANARIGRVNADGSVDRSFGGGDGWAEADFGRWESVRAMAVQRDGKIIAAGFYYFDTGPF